MLSASIKDLDWPDDSDFDLNSAEPQQAISYSHIGKKISQCHDYIDSLSKSDVFEAIPTRAIGRIASLLKETEQGIADANSKFEAASAQEGFSQFTEEFVLSSADGVVNLELGSLYRLLFEKLDNIAYEYSIISHFLKVEGAGGFYFKKAEVDRIVSRIEDEAYSVEKLQSQLEEAQKLQKRLIKQYQEDLENINSSRDTVTIQGEEIASTFDSLSSRISETDEAISSAESVISQSKDLEEKVQIHNEFILAHQGKLETLQAEIEAEKVILDNIKDKHIRRTDEIQRQAEDAEKMLQGATIAGLAGEFGSIKSKLETDLTAARNAVHLSAFLLFLSVLPIVFYVFGPVLGIDTNINLGFGGGDTLAQSLTGLAMRAVLLIPATWFARFSAKRYDRIFRLREHYAYKYSLATAVEGFKKQAPGYENDIAAETFYELTFNPAERLDPPRNEKNSKRRESLVLNEIRRRLKSREKVENSEA